MEGKRERERDLLDTKLGTEGERGKERELGTK